MHTICTANRNSAMGFDCIHIKLIYLAKNQIIPYLTKLFNLIYVIHAKSPSLWKYTDLFQIPKPGRDNIIIKNNRLISLLPALARIIEKAIANRVLTYMHFNQINQLMIYYYA
jgi:hypothetical protein